MRASLFIISGLILLAGLFLLLRPVRPEPPPRAPVAALPSPGASELAVTEVPELLPEDQDEWPVVMLRVVNGVLEEGPSLIRVQQGDPVQILIESDQDDEFHLHGYDLVLPLKAGVPAELQFTADRSGRFTYELHARHLELGALEVLPR
jgi:FtsP/CotA-like multicopper oxidase with cupredoxin domain